MLLLQIRIVTVPELRIDGSRISGQQVGQRLAPEMEAARHRRGVTAHHVEEGKHVMFDGMIIIVKNALRRRLVVVGGIKGSFRDIIEQPELQRQLLPRDLLIANRSALAQHGACLCIKLPQPPLRQLLPQAGQLRRGRFKRVQAHRGRQGMSQPYHTA